MESDRVYVQDIGQTVDQLIDQINDMSDQQERIGTKLTKIQKKQSEVPSLVLPSLNQPSNISNLQTSQLPELVKNIPATGIYYNGR